MMRIFSADHANLRAALDWFHSSGEGDAELRLVTALSEFWNLGGHYREAWKSIRTALETSTPLATQVRALALAEASDWARFAGRVDLAREYCNESLAISRQIGDERGIRRALHELGEAAAEEEAYAEAAALYEQAIAAARAVGEDAPGSIANLGWVTLQQGDARQARALFEQSLPFWRDHGNAEGTMVLLEFLAEANLALGETEQTRDHLLEGLELASAAEAAGDTAVEMLETAAELLLQSGAPEEAARIAGASDALLEAGGFRPVSADRRRRERLRADLSTSLGPALDTLLAEGRETAGHAKDLAAQAIAALPLE
jgi:tetratricopeptide (TPR) repeat protein